MLAEIHLSSLVSNFVIIQLGLRKETLLANCADEGRVGLMLLHVPQQGGSLCEVLFALSTEMCCFLQVLLLDVVLEVIDRTVLLLAILAHQISRG